jgi:hypothetical protein
MAILTSGAGTGANATVLLSLDGFNPLVGILPTPAVGTLYTVPANFRTTVASIEVFNNSGGVANITIYLRVGGTDYPLRGAALNNLDALVDTLSRGLPAGTIIKGVSDVANVTYVLQLQETAV